MILTKLILTDFGVFRGRQTIELAPRPRRPIVLFGGKNGAGKSTLLEAVRLCFYGSGANGTRSREDYLKYLDGKIHSNPNGLIQPTFASVAVEFQYGDPDGLHAYTVTRAWERRGPGRIVETFTVQRDGRAVDDIAADHWQDFIRDLIPPGVSQLFFFDGEKIQQLAESSTDQQTLASAIKALLGVDTVERLQADLGIYLARLIKPLQNKEHTRDLEQLESEIAGTEQRLTSSRERRTDEEQRATLLRAGITRLEERIATQGGSFTRNRDSLIQQKAKLKGEIEQQERALRDLCAGLLPFTIVPGLCGELKQQLLLEENAVRAEAARKELCTARTKILKHVQSKAFWTDLGNVPKQVRNLLHDRIEHVVAASFAGFDDDQPTEVVHGVPEAVRGQLLTWIDQATGDTTKVGRSLHADLERSYSELERAETALRKIPPDEVLKPLLQELHDMHRQLADASKAALLIAEEIKGLEMTLSELRRRYERITEKLAAETRQGSRIHLVPRVQKVLEEYKSALVSKKVVQLQDAVTECFNTLCRKKDALRRIVINPVDFSVSLQDKHGGEIPKSQLSAGEKQIYAISMLWALAKTAGRPLPIIIDTPLARLDSDHRKLLASHYFPVASHQVLILSTDTEVDQPYFEDLRHATGKTYRLDFDPEENGTKIENGYFWRFTHETHQVTPDERSV